MDHRAVAVSQLVVLGGDSAELLDVAEVILDQMPCPVSKRVVLGIGTFQRRNLIKEFPPHVVDRRRSGGETLFLRAKHLDDFMRRDSRKWESPSKRNGSWIKRLFGRAA